MDRIWIRGEKTPRDVKVVTDTWRTMTYEEAGKKTTIDGWRVRRVWREGTPAAIDDGLAMMESGDFAGAAKHFDLLKGPDAAFHRANARRLQAEMEGEGGADALAALCEWLDKNGDHRLAPLAALAASEIVVESGGPARDVLAPFLDAKASPWSLHARVVLSWKHVRRVDAKDHPAAAERELVAVEREGLEHEFGHEAAQRARIARARAIGGGQPRDGAKLLAEVVDHEAWIDTPARLEALNVLGDLMHDAAGRGTDGLVAALPFRLKVIRYATAQPLERARALGGAVRALAAVGSTDSAATFKRELLHHYAGSKWAKGI